MKRGTPDHPKVFDLCDRLGCDRPTAIGYLEMLWHFTAKYAPQGDIGRYSDHRIEAALDWFGRGKPAGKLMRALVDSRWIDRDGKYRLAIHDWSSHADESVRLRLKRAGLSFVCVGENVSEQSPVSVGDSIATKTPLPVPEPEPEPVPEPSLSPRPIRQGRNITPAAISPGTWDAFQKQYAESGKPLNEADWMKAGMEAATSDLSDSDMTERVIPALAAELPGWAERDLGMIPYPANWLKSQPWTRKAKRREPPLTREQRKQLEIEEHWGGARATR